MTVDIKCPHQIHFGEGFYINQAWYVFSSSIDITDDAKLLKMEKKKKKRQTLTGRKGRPIGLRRQSGAGISLSLG